VAILGLSFKYELHVLHVGLFGNYEGIGLYQQYVYGAIFVALAAGLLQLLHLGRLEALKNYVVTNMGSTRQTFPAIVFYASSVLYMVPGLVHQITSQKIRTLYFLALFFVFLFFAPVRPFLPLSEELRQKWSLAGERWANRINAVASGAVLLLLVIMVGFGFFDPNRPWPKALQILVSVLLLICAMLASPLYVVMKDVREDRTDAHPSDVQRFAQRTDEWQQDINKGIFYSFASLIATALVTHRYLRNKQPLAEKKRKPVATAGEDPYRFVE
jgi:hypothetical protein